MSLVQDDRELEAQRANYLFFKDQLHSLLAKHEGRYALVRNQRIESVFDDPGTAIEAGDKDGGVFLVQAIRPVQAHRIAYAA